MKNDSHSAMRFCEEMSDSRLTVPSNGKVYCLRKAILLSKRLGRPLTKKKWNSLKFNFIRGLYGTRFCNSKND